MMPGGMDGQQLAAEVRRCYFSVPVLVMSGYANSVTLDVESLHKSFSRRDLCDTLARAMSSGGMSVVAGEQAYR